MHKHQLVPVKLIRIQQGDTLFGIAKRELGNGYRWPEIFELSGDLILHELRTRGFTPHRMKAQDYIFAGATLRIPTC